MDRNRPKPTIIGPIAGLLLLCTTPLSEASAPVTQGYRGVGLKRKRRAVVSQGGPAWQLGLRPMEPAEYSQGGGKGHAVRGEVEGEGSGEAEKSLGETTGGEEFRGVAEGRV